VNLSHVGLVAARNAGDLDMAHEMDVLAQRVGEMPFEHLHVIAVQMQREIRMRHRLDDRASVRRVIQEIAMHALRRVRRSIGDDAHLLVDGLDDHVNTVRLEKRCCVAKIVDVRAFALRVVHARSHHAGHHVHAFAAERGSVLHDAIEARAKLRFPPRYARHATIACIPVAHRGIEQHHLQAMCVQTPPQLAGRMIVGHLELDAAESRARRRLEAFEERHFGEEVVEVGGELGHG